MCPILKDKCLHRQMICGYFTTFSLVSNIKITASVTDVVTLRYIEFILWIVCHKLA